MKYYRLNLIFITALFLVSLPGVAVSMQVPEDIKLYISDFNQHELRQEMEAHASDVLTDINRAFSAERDPSVSRAGTTEDLRDALAKLWSVPFYIPEPSIIETATKLSSGYYEVRNIPIYLVDEEGKEHYEEAVMQFTPTGILDDIRIGLPAHRFQQLLKDGKDEIDMVNRRKILQFVENLRTAYNKKDLDYIASVFSAQALIIVGRVIENTGEESAFQQQVEYLQYTKEEYVERLELVFNANTWIDVGYEEIQILRHPLHDDIYGVSLTQYYSSSIYSDEGFLFLLTDFKEPENPMIHVRTWQPKTSTPVEQVFTLGDMEIF